MHPFIDISADLDLRKSTTIGPNPDCWWFTDDIAGVLPIFPARIMFWTHQPVTYMHIMYQADLIRLNRNNQIA